MKPELKAFQERAALEIIAEINDARTSAAKGRAQAVVLSAPTGSGKTITLARVIDLTLGGDEGIPSRPKAVFLWLSDSPELNAQSRDKLMNFCDHVPFHRLVTVESEKFDATRFLPGHVYFINTQLLGRDKLLTKDTGDRRRYTFWQTVANTVAAAPEEFILVIDEAHRGATVSDRARTPIMQKFILGSPDDGLPPVPLILGMSATPQRFNMLLGTTPRTQRPICISPEDVRTSGLLKEMLVVRSPKDNVATDLTLLEDAVRTWGRFTTLWADYCAREKEAAEVRPILVVQVEDGTQQTLTRTSLGDVIKIIERIQGPVAPGEIVHCFQDPAELMVGNYVVRKIEASRIQDSSEVKVVLFKTALTTGWDCPRAEVMMSFRRAKDPTSIAQLVGRMIRTPLARRIESNEVLNTVELFLPHYDADALKDVLARLRNPEAEEGNATRVETHMVGYGRAPGMLEVFQRITGLPCYAMRHVARISSVRRVLRLTAMLVHEGIDTGADEEVRTKLIGKLRELRDLAAANDPGWDKTVREGGEVEMEVTHVAVGQMNVSAHRGGRLTLTAENIDQMFDAAGRAFGAGTGLHRTYWRNYHDAEDPDRAKLELAQLAVRPSILSALEVLADGEFERLWKQHLSDIKKTPAKVRQEFSELVESTGDAIEIGWELPDQIVEKSAGADFPKHLYADADGRFSADLNGWERELLEREMNRADFVAWLRNQPRRDGAMCIPYEAGGPKGFFPDFVIIRRVRENLIVDLVEPHDDSRADTWAKAKGLAVFADRHGMEFGRLIIARRKAGAWQAIDLNSREVRERARRMQSGEDLEGLFSMGE